VTECSFIGFSYSEFGCGAPLLPGILREGSVRSSAPRRPSACLATILTIISTFFAEAFVSAERHDRDLDLMAG